MIGRQRRWRMATGLVCWLAAVAPPVASAEDFARYPVLVPGAQAHYLSSFDRSGGNDDGFDGTYSALYVSDAGEHVIFDVQGPGVLHNLWFTSRVSGHSPLETGRIRFYFDGETSPRIDMDIDAFFSGRHPPFVPPYVYHSFQSTGGYVSYMPFPFSTRLTITTERRVGFYNAYYRTFAPGTAVVSWTEDSERPSFEREERTGGDVHSGTISLPAPAMPDGDPVPSRVTLLEHEGRGAIASLRLNPLFPLTDYELDHILLEVYWDGRKEPGIDAPLGIFFGSGLGEADVRALPLGMSPSGPYYCDLPMPFWEGFRIELVNENPAPTPELWWQVRIDSSARYDGEETGHLNARYRREWPTSPGQDYRILDQEGSGTYLGQVMTVEPLRAEVKRWWEGDLRVYLDGRRQPAFHGTGHEDEYLGGWSNEWLMNPYSLPMHGEPKTAELKQVDFQWSAATTVYRFFVEGIPYRNGISVSTEHGSRNSADALYSSVAFFYARPEALQRLATLEVEGDRELTSQFEGRRDDEDVTDTGRRVAGRSSFAFDVPPGVSELRLRRLYDQSEVQEAEVWINGARVGVWYDPATNAHKRWAESDFLLPESVANGTSRLEIEIRALRSGWSEYRYELWGMP